MRSTTGAGRPVRWRCAGAVASLLVAGSAACAQSSGRDLSVVAASFEATPEFVAGAVERSHGSTYRIEMDMTMSMTLGRDDLLVDGTVMTGEVDGDRSSMTMDLAPVFEDMADVAGPGESPPAELLAGDLTIDTVFDGETMYMRAPMYETLADVMLANGARRSDLGPLGDLAELGGEWGRIDLEDVSINDVAGTAGVQAADPGAFLDMISGAADLRELGDGDVRGVPVEGLAATITFAAMIESGGADLDQYREQLSETVPANEVDQLERVMDEFLDSEVPVEVWFDDSGFVRRVSIEMDMAAMLSDVIPVGDDDAPDEFSFGMTMDFFDYGDESIEVEVPAESVDMSDVFRDLMESGPATGSGEPVTD